MADNVKYSHQLEQTVAEIQAALNMLTKNGKPDPNYMLTSDGYGKVQFIPKIRSGDAYININHSTGIITLNYGALVNSVTTNVSNSAALERTINRENDYLSDVNYKEHTSKYPTTSFVAYLAEAVAAAATAHVRNMSKDTNYNTVKKIVELFKSKSLTSSVLYTSIVEADINGVSLDASAPCIFIQAGAGVAEGSPATLLLIYKDIWLWIEGEVNASSGIDVKSQNIYQLNTLATKTEVADVATAANTALSTTKTELEAAIVRATTDMATKTDLAEAITEAVTGAITQEY